MKQRIHPRLYTNMLVGITGEAIRVKTSNFSAQLIIKQTKLK